MATKDPLDDYHAALDRLAALTAAVASQADQEEVLEAITQLRLSVVRAYEGRRPRRPHGRGARGLILDYLKLRVGEWVYGDELAAVSGIGEWARRVRELRVEEGYGIEESGGRYRLVAAEPNVARRERWRMVGDVQQLEDPPKERVSELLRRAVGQVVHVDELDRVAGSQIGERLARSLRDDYGFPIETDADAPDLQPGQVRLASTQDWAKLDQTQRLFPEDLRRQVFQRDRYRCWSCQHSHADVSQSETQPFYLLVRHLDARGDGLFGLSAERLGDLSRLATICNRCASSGTVIG
ncbi:MAG: hypothetical protein K1X67_19645 [Fimbriimonadaceae bacterium]|nr:hypothetical protein [Fimbriimonadaceae bacterium]